MSRHELFNPEGLPPARGFSYGSIAGPGRLVHIAGITGHREDESIDDDIVAQFAGACRSVARIIEDAGGRPDDLVSMTIYTPAIDDYRANLRPIGVAYREVFGKHFPPMALFEVNGLFDPKAVVELVCVAVVPESG